MLTLGQFQNLVDEIDNTGNQGTTGQELINLFNAVTQDRYDYTEVSISAAQFLALQSSPLQVFPDLPLTQYYDAKIILEFKSGGTPFSLTNVHSVLLGNTYLNKNFLTLNSTSILFADTHGEQSDSSGVIVRSRNNVGSGIYLSLYSLGPSPTISLGNGSALAKVYYKVRDLDSELTP